MKKAAAGLCMSIILLLFAGGCGADKEQDGFESRGSQAESETEPGAGAKTEAGTGTESESGAEPGAEPEAGTESGAGAEAESETGDESAITAREEFYRRAEMYEGLSEEETDVLYQRLLDSNVMELEGMTVTGMAAGDYDGNGHTDMIVCLFSTDEDADYYRDGCLYLFMNEDEPYYIYDEFCCYGGAICDDFGADIDRDGKTEVVMLIQGRGNGGPGDFCKIAVKYQNPGIQKMELPSNMSGEDCGIEVVVEGDPKKGVYIVYCSEFDEEIEFRPDREVDDQRGGNCRGYCDLKMGEYQGEEVFLGYEYLFAGGIVDYVGNAVFVIDWDEEGSPYVRDWYIEGVE